MRNSGNTILITGAGSGIGEALAHRFHDLGNTVIIAGRRPEALQRAAAGRENIHCVTVDVADATGVAAFADVVLRDHPALNVLVNNAGIMRYEDIGDARDLADTEAMITTNLLGPIRLIDALIEHLKARRDAAIVNVTSGLAFVPLLKAAAYSAAKAGLHSYTVSLREMLAGRVEVIELAPPAVRTGLTPGQESIEAFMPLTDYVDEVMQILSQEPIPAEVVVKRCEFLRHAEAEGRFREALAAVNV